MLKFIENLIWTALILLLFGWLSFMILYPGQVREYIENKFKYQVVSAEVSNSQFLIEKAKSGDQKSIDLLIPPLMGLLGDMVKDGRYIYYSKNRTVKVIVENVK